MSRNFRSKGAAAAAAMAAACLVTAAPADAAATVGGPQSGVAGSEKSANVTVTVLGKLPEPAAQADVRSRNVATPAADTVPFDFHLYGVWSLKGRDFTSARTVVCKDIAITYSGGGPGTPPATNFQVSLSAGGYVRVPIDGIARSYCWSGVPTGKVVYFYYRMTDEPNGGSYSKVDGSGRVRYADQ
jgi:hypothetical protein